MSAPLPPQSSELLSTGSDVLICFHCSGPIRAAGCQPVRPDAPRPCVSVKGGDSQDPPLLSFPGRVEPERLREHPKEHAHRRQLSRLSCVSQMAMTPVRTMPIWSRPMGLVARCERGRWQGGSAGGIPSPGEWLPEQIRSRFSSCNRRRSQFAATVSLEASLAERFRQLLAQALLGGTHGCVMARAIWNGCLLG